MGTDASSLFETRRVFASRNAEATRAFMRSKEFDLDLDPRDEGEFDFSASAAYLPHSYVGYVRYGSSVRVRVPEARSRDDYFIHLPVNGASEVENRQGSVVCGPGKAVVSSPNGHEMRSGRGSGRITISITKSALIRQLATLLGSTPARPLDFVACLDLHSPQGRSFDRQARSVIDDLYDPASCPSPVMLGMYEQLLMTGLLLSQPNTYSDALERIGRGAAPRAVKVAIDYMEGNLSDPITLGDIVRAAGVPGRTLLKHFQDHQGASPMRHLRDARLDRIRQELARGGVETVTEVALRWGMSHMGRFAQDYRRRFGESPSETGRRSGREVGPAPSVSD